MAHIDSRILGDGVHQPLIILQLYTIQWLSITWNFLHEVSSPSISDALLRFSYRLNSHCTLLPAPGYKIQQSRSHPSAQVNENCCSFLSLCSLWALEYFPSFKGLSLCFLFLPMSPRILVSSTFLGHSSFWASRLWNLEMFRQLLHSWKVSLYVQRHCSSWALSTLNLEEVLDLYTQRFYLSWDFLFLRDL